MFILITFLIVGTFLGSLFLNLSRKNKAKVALTGIATTKFSVGFIWKLSKDVAVTSVQLGKLSSIEIEKSSQGVIDAGYENTHVEWKKKGSFREGVESGAELYDLVGLKGLTDSLVVSIKKANEPAIKKEEEESK